MFERSGEQFPFLLELSAIVGVKFGKILVKAGILDVRFQLAESLLIPGMAIEKGRRGPAPTVGFVFEMSAVAVIENRLE